MSAATQQEIEYVTAAIGGQLFGLPIAQVRDVFAVDRLTPVPLAPSEVAGLLNLRGRIVTAIDASAMLGLPRGAEARNRMAIGIERGSECYGLLIDAIGEVVRLPASGREDVPVNLDLRIARVATGVHRLDAGLLVVLDADRVLDVGGPAEAA